jgi:hypothetical protein
MISEVYHHLAPLFLSYGEAEHHRRRAWQRKIAHFMEVKKRDRQKETETKRQRERGQDIFPRSPVTHFLQLASTSYFSQSPKIAPPGGTQAFSELSCKR